MPEGTTFEDFLIAKKIDSRAFLEAEPDLWEGWKNEFEQMHPASFTVRKLNLINAIRRKYLLPTQPKPVDTQPKPAPTTPTTPAAKPGRPVMKPRMNQ